MSKFLSFAVYVLCVFSSASYSYASASSSQRECLDQVGGANLISPDLLQKLDSVVQAFVAEDAIGATLGKKSFVVAEAKRLKEDGKIYNSKILDFSASSNNSVDKALALRSLKKWKDEISAGVGVSFFEGVHSKYLMCALKSVSVSASSRFFAKTNSFIDDAARKFNSSSIGYFDVKINNCSIKSRVGTGNPYAEPKVWEGSVFLVIDASFKNTDTEGRLPVEGDALIESEGREYVYDHTETILMDGYGVFLDSVNPLVTMRTKIVYRIPSEIKGEIYWRPGRNPSKTKLWCGYRD